MTSAHTSEWNGRKVDETTHLPTHVAVCLERYRSLEGRLSRIERIAYGIFALMILQGVGVFDWLKSTLPLP